MSLIQKVKHTLSWKKSDGYCAERLGIPLDRYKDLKQQLLSRSSKVTEWKESLEEGKAEVKGISSTEPRSPEEIIRILKIDTSS